MGADLSRAWVMNQQDDETVTYEDVLFADASLSWIEFHDDDLSLTSMRNTNLSNAHLYGVNLAGVDMSGSDWTGAGAVGDFTGVDLTGANFAPSWVTGDFTGADFTGADFSGLEVWGGVICPDGWDPGPGALTGPFCAGHLLP